MDRDKSVSYTHLDVYKRQTLQTWNFLSNWVAAISEWMTLPSWQHTPSHLNLVDCARVYWSLHEAVVDHYYEDQSSWASSSLLSGKFIGNLKLKSDCQSCTSTFCADISSWPQFGGSL